MANILDNVSYLAEEIGPRPAGTEEEQQAALYIAEKLQSESGFHAEVEDFKCVPDISVIKIACVGVALIAALVAFLFSAAAIPAIIVALIIAALSVLEDMDRPVVTRLLATGISQNVVAKYEPRHPDERPNPRRRKVVLVAHYDSGRAMPLMQGPFMSILPIMQKGTRIAVVLVPILLLIRHLAFANSAGILALLFNIVIVVGMVFMLLTLAWEVLHRLQQYNDAANSNAAGVAVMMEVARRINEGSMSEADIEEQEALIHGEEAARAEGLVPDGAEISYEVAPTEQTKGTPQQEAEQLAAAKAAIAAMTGVAVSGAMPVADISENLVKVEPEPVKETAELRHEQNMEIRSVLSGEAQQAAERASSEDASEAENAPQDDTTATAEQNEQSTPIPVAPQKVDQVAAPVVSTSVSSYEDDESLPDWYRKAQQRAKKQPQPESNDGFRSRFAATLDATEEKLHEQDIEREELARQQELQERMAAAHEEQLKASAAQAPASQEQSGMAQEAAVHTPTVPRETKEAVLRMSGSKPKAVSRETAPVPTPSEQEKVPEAAPAPAHAEYAASREVREQKARPSVRRTDNASAPEEKPRMAVADEQIEAGVHDEPARRVAARQQMRVKTDEAVEEVRENRSEFIPAKEQRTEEKAPMTPPDATTAMAPIDVSDLLAEMKEMKTAEPAVPTFITGEQETAQAQEEKTEEAPEVESSGEKQSDKHSHESQLIDPDAPFIPVPVERPVVLSPEQTAEIAKAEPVKRSPIVLPDLPEPEVAPIAEVTKQRAPLADVTDNKAKAAARNLLSTVLPEVGGAQPEQIAPAASVKHHVTDLPSLSGELRSQASSENAETSEHATVSATGSFATVGATGSFAPVGDELVADLDPDDLYVTDADDSEYAENFTETGAFAGPGYVEMPKSRMQKLFGKFGFGKKKKHQEEMSAHEWLDVDEDFDARSVGKQRGGWESFNTEEHAGYADNATSAQGVRKGDTGDFSPATAQYDENYASAYVDGSGYYGADDYEEDAAHAAPLPANSPLRRGNTFDNVSYDDSFDEFEDDDFSDSTKRWNGGAVSSNSASTADDVSEELEETSHTVSESKEKELKEIYQFRNPDIDMDVWFVALGSTLSNNEGMKQLIAAHKPELKRAIVINLESLGDGELTFVNKEGSLKKRTVTSRMKRCLKKASQMTGISCGTREIAWRESPATVAMANGLQGMTLAGMNGLKPAGYAEVDDEVASVSEETLQANAEYVLSILKNI